MMKTYQDGIPDETLITVNLMVTASQSVRCVKVDFRCCQAYIRDV